MYLFKTVDIDLDSYFDKLLNKIKNNKTKIDSLLSIDDKSYENFVIPYQQISLDLDQFFTLISHINSVKNSDKTNEIYEKSIQEIVKYNNWLLQNVDIYQSFKNILSNQEKSLNDIQIRVLKLQIQEYELNGCNLNEEDKKTLQEIELKLSKLSNDFSQNLIKATNDYELICDEQDILDMPNSLKQLYKIDENKYKFTLQAPSYIAFMEYCNNRNLREALYKAYTTRAPQNEDLIEQIVKLKERKAKLLGFNNYSCLSLSQKIANSEDEVINFLYEIVKYAKPKAKEELDKLKEFALKDNIKDFKIYDVNYYSRIIKNKFYDIDEEFYKQYFEQNSVIEGLFKFLDILFDLKFEKLDEELWDKKAVSYLVYENDKIIAKLYFDLEARSDKKGGAWMHDFQTHYNIENHKELPSAFIVANFTPSKGDMPSLLTHDEVVTLFHEMGHALHHILSKIDEPFVSGINGVEWDGVEFPSQFLEYFAYEKEVLKIFAKHYKTNEILDDNSIEKLKKTKNFHSAMQTIRQIEFALFDFKLYQKARDKKAIQKLLDDIRKEVAVILPPKYNKFQNGFSHIFAGGYSAGYYSYKWAEVMSAGAFLKFINPLDKTEANRFKEIILYRGGSEKLDKLFYKFTQKEIDIKDLLKIDGILI